MTAKVLCSFYPQESGFKVHRVYLESNFKQAEADVELMLESNHDKSWVLRNAEVFEADNIEPTPIEKESMKAEDVFDREREKYLKEKIHEYDNMVIDVKVLKDKIKTLEKQRSYLVYGFVALIIIKSFFDLIELS